MNNYLGAIIADVMVTNVVYFFSYSWGGAAMNEMLELQQSLYLKEVERLLKRPADIVEMKAIKDAFVRQWNSIETARLITGASNRVDRQNDFA